MKQVCIIVLVAILAGIACRNDSPPAPSPTLVADPGGPYQARLGQDLVVSGIRSTSSPLQIAQFEWNCGQTTPTVPDSCERSTTTPTTTFRYRRGTGAQNTYTLRLVVVDTAGNRSPAATTQVTVLNQY